MSEFRVVNFLKVDDSSNSTEFAGAGTYIFLESTFVFFQLKVVVFLSEVILFT